MLNNYIYTVLNIMSTIALILFIYSLKRASKELGNDDKDSILLKTGVDEINIYLFLFIALLILWRIDTIFALYRGQILLKTLFSTDAFILINCMVIVLYCTINRNTITTSGIARLHLFNNCRNIIQWKQILNYHWEDNCLIINYLNESEVDTYLWKNVSYRDRGTIEAIFNNYLCKGR